VMLMIFSILMHIVSLTFQKAMVITVRGQYPDMKPISSVYFCNHGTHYEYPKRTNTGTVMKVEFRFDSDQDVFEGILMCKVRRERDIRFNQQSSTNTIYTKVIEEASKMMQLLVTWKIERLGRLKVNVILIEYDDGLVLNEDKLKQLYDKVNNIPTNYNESKWLMCDNTVLEVAHKAVHKAILESTITIFEGPRCCDSIKPMRIDSSRQVLLEVVVHFY
jgi:hypothetical protein